MFASLQLHEALLAAPSAIEALQAAPSSVDALQAAPSLSAPPAAVRKLGSVLAGKQVDFRAANYIDSLSMRRTRGMVLHPVGQKSR